MWSIFDVIVFAAGFGACWFSRDWLMMSYDRIAKFIRRLEAKAKSIRETL
jgi:hypothetical protein